MFARRSVFLQILRVTGLFLMGLVVAIIVALSQVDLESLRGDIVSVLRDATGLPVEIDGAVSWKFSLRPQIELNQVRIANADWAKHKDAFHAEKIDVTLNLVSLFRDRPTIQNIVIYNATTCIETNADGIYSITPAKIANNTDGQNMPQTKYLFREMGLGGIEIKNLRAHVFEETYDLAGVSVRYIKSKDNREYAGWFKSIDDVVFPFIINFSEYNPERKIYPMRIAISTGGDALIANVALEGTSKTPIDFIVKGDVPNVDALGKIFNMDLKKWPDISVNMAGGFDRRRVVFRKSSVAFNGANVDFSGEYDWGRDAPRISLNINGGVVALMDLFPGLYGKTWVRPKRDLNVFKDIPLHGKFFVNRNVDINVDVGGLVIYRELVLKDLKLAVNIADNHGTIKLNSGVADGGVRLAADLDISPDGHIDMIMGGIGERIFVGDLLDQLDSSDLISELPMNFELYVRANGSNLSEIMKTITGPVRVYSVGSGYAHSALVAYMYGTDFLTSLRHSIQDLFRSEKKHDQIKISCAAINVKLRDGRIETEQGVAIETNAVNMRLAGNLDLGEEEMRMALTTVPVRGIKLSLTGKVVNSIEVSGNLAEPNIAISGAAVAGKVASATGIGLLLAPFTGGIGLVAGAGVGWLAGDLLENWLADGTPCETALERGAPAYRDDEAWINAPMADLVSGILN